MTDLLAIIFRNSILMFLVGNYLGMRFGRILKNAWDALWNVRFAVFVVVWVWILCPAFTCLPAQIVPMDRSYALGLILMGMIPCAPFTPLMVNNARKGLAYTAAFVLLAALTGCTHLGPPSVAVDRFDYSAAISDSWKQQTLLNIVKLRYMDLPVFLDVASIVSGYSMQTGVSVNGTLSSEKAIQGDYASIGGQAIYTDRPTITYVPKTGNEFLRGLLTPIDPKNIFFLLQSGYAADFILGMAVESINGVRNRSTTGGTVREADPEFIRALELLREVQAAGGFGMRVEEDKVKGSTGVVFFRRDEVSPDIAEKAAEIRRLFKLAAEPQKFVITYSPVRGAENELAVNSRSMLQIMQAFASYLEVPKAHLKDQSAWPSPAAAPGAENRQLNVRIHSGKDKPAGAFAAVRYRDYWFWVDNSDRQTKRALTVVMFFFTLTEIESPQKLPLITIPVQ